MQAYSVTNPLNSDEYYIVEYRPSEKYDSKIPDHGVLLWYIDYDDYLYKSKNAINKDENHQRVAVKKVLKSKQYYVDFSFVNRGGVAAVPGVYSVVLEGDRACFTTSSNLNISQCPVMSSSSQESSSSGETLSSSSAEEKIESSSSEKTLNVIADGYASMKKVQLHLDGCTMHIAFATSGKNTVALCDMQGRLLLQKTFSGKTASLYLGAIKKGGYVVRLGGKDFSENRKIVLE